MDQSDAPAPPAKVGWAGLPGIGDVWQRLVTSGTESGTAGWRRRTFRYAFASVAVLVGTVNIINVITAWHEMPEEGLLGPVVWEGSSWLTWIAFFWVIWLFYRAAPPTRLGWRLILHPFGAVIFSLCHVVGFVLLRKAAYWTAGDVYRFGNFWPHFLYEFGKDALGYGLSVGGLAIMEQLARARSEPAPGEAMTYSIRDGGSLLRVAFADILAVGSAGNYVEFVLGDGRKPLMREALSRIETQLAPHGFLRVHRSWLINPARMTELTPDGSGDYTIRLGEIAVPLSRRFPDALAKLRGG